MVASRFRMVWWAAPSLFRRPQWWWAPPSDVHFSPDVRGRQGGRPLDLFSAGCAWVGATTPQLHVPASLPPRGLHGPVVAGSIPSMGLTSAYQRLYHCTSREPSSPVPYIV